MVKSCRKGVTSVYFSDDANKHNYCVRKYWNCQRNYTTSNNFTAQYLFKRNNMSVSKKKL